MRHVHEFKTNFVVSDDVATDVIGHASADGDGQADLPPKVAPVDHRSNDAVDLALHEEDSTVRNLCFVWPEGRTAFFNYAYLVSVDLTCDGQINMMRLVFSSYIVTLKGYSLQTLFASLLTHSPKTITATQPRYITDANRHEMLIIEIMVKSE